MLTEDQVFEKEDFSKATLEGPYEYCQFKQCNFSNGSLTEVRFMECSFHQCDFTLCKIGETAFQDVLFEDCKLLGLKFETCRTLGLAMKFKRCLLDHASFAGLKLPKMV